MRAGSIALILLAASEMCWASERNRVGLSSFCVLDYPDLSVAVSVTDKATEASIKGLKPDDFTATIDGQSCRDATVESVLSGGRKIAVAMLVDTSGSMKGVPLESAKRAISDMLGRLSSGDRASIIGFAGRVRPGGPYTTDRRRLRSELAGLRSGGETALFAAVVRACESVAAEDCDRKVVVVLSDGRDNASGISYSECLRRAKASGAPVYVIGLGRDIAEEQLREIASESGGRYFAAASAADLQSIYQSIAENLQNQYFVRVVAPASLKPGTWHELGIAVGDASGKAGFMAAVTEKREMAHERAFTVPPNAATVALGSLVAANALAVGALFARRLGRRKP